MSRPRRLFLLVAIVLSMVVIGMFCSSRSKGQAALAKYKAELRAKGEKLSAEELGYPKPPEISPGLDQLLVAASQVGTMKFQPSTLNLMSFSGPGQVRVLWASSEPRLHLSSAGAGSNDWETVVAQFANGSDITAEFRAAVQTPPRYFYNDLTNFTARPPSPFGGIRTAAQWLAGDAITALRADRLEAASADLHALVQLAQFFREDHTLVSQMIRVAVAGLGLSVTWQALQADDWNEPLLASMQKDWEALNLSDAYEIGIVGERAFGASVFTVMRSASSRERMRFFRLNWTSPVQLKSPKDYFDAYIGMPFWSANMDADEMLLLRHHQENLDAVRTLRTGAPWSVINANLYSNHMEFNKVVSSPVGRYRYRFSATANSTKAASVCVRAETQRRLTVAAIALKRYELRHQSKPATLATLVPEFLSAVPIDPMSGKPLSYRTNQTGYVLYSAGEDGVDDGGDPLPPAGSKATDIWSGRDAVWPTAASEGP